MWMCGCVGCAGGWTLFALFEIRFWELGHISRTQRRRMHACMQVGALADVVVQLPELTALLLGGNDLDDRAFELLGSQVSAGGFPFCEVLGGPSVVWVGGRVGFGGAGCRVTHDRSTHAWISKSRGSVYVLGSLFCGEVERARSAPPAQGLKEELGCVILAIHVRFGQGASIQPLGLLAL